MTSATKNIQGIQKNKNESADRCRNAVRVNNNENTKLMHEADLRKNIDEHELSLYNKFIYAYNHFTRKGMVNL